MLVPSAQMFFVWQLDQLDDPGVQMKTLKEILSHVKHGGYV